jgi:hypothetical protein
MRGPRHEFPRRTPAPASPLRPWIRALRPAPSERVPQPSAATTCRATRRPARFAPMVDAWGP